jgi:thiopurine S-methyltransferase
MEITDWLQRWDSGQIGFHREEVGQELAAHVAKLGDAPPAWTRVLVPLAGKSRDMTFLARRGHPVVGVEVAEKAIDAYFAEHGITPARSQAGDHERYEGGGVTLLRGDMLSVRPEAVGLFDAAYDRGALVAMRPDQRDAYARTVLALLRPGARVLLVAIEYDQAQMSGPPFSVEAHEILRLYGEACSIELLSSADALEPRFQERGLTRMREVTWLLRKR